MNLTDTGSNPVISTKCGWKPPGCAHARRQQPNGDPRTNCLLFDGRRMRKPSSRISIRSIRQHRISPCSLWIPCSTMRTENGNDCLVVGRIHCGATNHFNSNRGKFGSTCTQASSVNNRGTTMRRLPAGSFKSRHSQGTKIK